mmetsp:Transcript_95/g.313  ORF Transcript_95/g.313 Transcript_95/m.313 type:complete len:163 (-) Transcript_95:204-692(-)
MAVARPCAGAVIRTRRAGTLARGRPVHARAQGGGRDGTKRSSHTAPAFFDPMRFDRELASKRRKAGVKPKISGVPGHDNVFAAVPNSKRRAEHQGEVSVDEADSDEVLHVLPDLPKPAKDGDLSQAFSVELQNRALHPKIDEWHNNQWDKLAEELDGHTDSS